MVDRWSWQEDRGVEQAWAEALTPAVAIGVELGRLDVEPYVRAAALAIRDASHSNDFRTVAHLCEDELLVFLQRRTQVSDLADFSQLDGQRIMVEPIGGRLDRGDLLLRLRLTYQMRPVSNTEIRREAWTVAVPLARIRHVSGAHRCRNCSAPVGLLGVCEYCGRLLTAAVEGEQPKVRTISAL